jgi:tetratricopeptide (TPR) repeat protein
MGAWRFATAWKRWGQQDRAEIDQTYRDELDSLKEELADAESDEETGRIKEEIRGVRREQRQFYRARRDLLLSKTLVQRMTPKGTIAAGAPQLLAPERETLRIAATLLQRLEPAIGFPDHFLRGNAFYIAGGFEKALAEYNAALAVRPDDPDTLNNRGAALIHLGRYEEALVDCSRALELRPDDPDTLTNRGAALIHLGRYEEALVDCSRALELRPDDPTALYNRACVLSLTQRWGESLADLRAAVAIDASNQRLAREDVDRDFEGLRNDPEWGPKFWEIVGREDQP